MSSITLKNIHKAYGKDVIIPDLNFTIEDGSFTVLVGPSGCGKSTTLRMIAGLEKPTSGEIFIDDENVVDVDPGKRGIAMVFQNYALYPTMSVRDNIEFGLKNKKVPKEERNKLIADVSEVVGLTPYLSRKPSELSGGQRQRATVLRNHTVQVGQSHGKKSQGIFDGRASVQPGCQAASADACGAD